MGAQKPPSNYQGGIPKFDDQGNPTQAAAQQSQDPQASYMQFAQQRSNAEDEARKQQLQQQPAYAALQKIAGQGNQSFGVDWWR